MWNAGEFVDTPIVTKGPVPHWSRWEKSATTFGPVGRVGATVVAVLWLLASTARSPLTLLFVLPLVGIVLREIWRPGWVLPRAETAPQTSRPTEPMSSWLWDRSEFLRTVILAVIALVGVAILMASGQPVAKFIVVITAVVAGVLWLFRRVGG